MNNFHLQMDIYSRPGQERIFPRQRRPRSQISIGILSLFLLLFNRAALGFPISLSNVVVRHLSCDATCDTLAFTAGVRGKDDIAVVVKGGMAWTPVLENNGNPVSFVSASAGAESLVAVAQSDILSMDAVKFKYKAIYSHAHRVFYPGMSRGGIFFSDGSRITPGVTNPFQNRRLYRYDPGAKKLERALVPWVAYSMGSPSLTKDGRLCLSVVLPYQEKSFAAADSIKFNGRSSFCFRQSALFTATDYSDFENALLPGLAGSFEELSVDAEGKVVAGYSIAVSPSAWLIYDVANQRVLRSISATGRNAVAIAANGKRFVQVAGGRGKITVTVFDVHSGTPVSSYEVDFGRVGKYVFRKGE